MERRFARFTALAATERLDLRSPSSKPAADAREVHEAGAFNAPLA